MENTHSSPGVQETGSGSIYVRRFSVARSLTCTAAVPSSLQRSDALSLLDNDVPHEKCSAFQHNAPIAYDTHHLESSRGKTPLARFGSVRHIGLLIEASNAGRRWCMHALLLVG